jgi:flagellar protein FliL
MSGTDETEKAEAPAAPAAPKSMGPMLLVIAGLVGGGLGGVAGAYLIAPRLAGGTTAQAATAPATAGTAPAAAPAAKPVKKGEKSEPARIYRIDNVIVNPAGSDGARFLMASIAYQIPDEASEQTLRAHEIQLRDDVVGALESMSMPRLTQPHARDTIKVQLLEIARRILGPQAQIDVFMPQFVIQ